MKPRLAALLLTLLWACLLVLSIPFTVVALPFMVVAHYLQKWAGAAYESAAEKEQYQDYDYEPWPDGTLFYFVVEVGAMMVMLFGMIPMRHSLDRVSYHIARAL